MSHCHASFRSSWRTNLCSIDQWNDKSPYSSCSYLLNPFFCMTMWLFWRIKWNPPLYLCSSTLLSVVKDATGVVCGPHHPHSWNSYIYFILLNQTFLCNLQMCVGGEYCFIFILIFQVFYTFELKSSHDTNVVGLFPRHWIWSWKENIHIRIETDNTSEQFIDPQTISIMWVWY